MTMRGDAALQLERAILRAGANIAATPFETIEYQLYNMRTTLLLCFERMLINLNNFDESIRFANKEKMGLCGLAYRRDYPKVRQL